MLLRLFQVSKEEGSICGKFLSQIAFFQKILTYIISFRISIEVAHWCPPLTLDLIALLILK